MAVVIELFDMETGLSQGFLSKFDPDYTNKPGKPTYPTGKAEASENIKEAMIFSDIEEAAAFYRQTSLTVPFRPDGEPNRPLTALNALFHSMAEVEQ
jgi:hypothetical protein